MYGEDNWKSWHRTKEDPPTGFAISLTSSGLLKSMPVASLIQSLVCIATKGSCRYRLPIYNKVWGDHLRNLCKEMLSLLKGTGTVCAWEPEAVPHGCWSSLGYIGAPLLTRNHKRTQKACLNGIQQAVQINASGIFLFWVTAAPKSSPECYGISQKVYEPDLTWLLLKWGRYGKCSSTLLPELAVHWGWHLGEARHHPTSTGSLCCF